MEALDRTREFRGRVNPRARSVRQSFARDDRVTAGAAIGFAVALFVNLVLTDPPDMATSHAETLRFYRDVSLQITSLLAAYAAAVTAFCFIVLVVGLVRSLELARERSAAIAGAIGGGVFVTLYLTGAALFAAPAFTILFGDELSLQGEKVPLTDDFAVFAGAAGAMGDIFLLLICGFAAAAFVAAISLGGRRAGRLPGWLSALGLVTALALVSPLVFFSLLFLIAWAALLGVRLLRHPLSGPR